MTSMTNLTIGSLFSGVGGLEHALLEDPRFELIYVADPDRYCEAVMNYIYRTTPNLGSVTTIKSDNISYTDIIMGGTSCQNFSYQGDKTGLRGKKSKLFYEFAGIIQDKQPKYAIWENVFGASTHADFQIIKQIFEDIGYEIDYDIFDSSIYSPTIQQRRRIILLATNKKYDKALLNRSIPDIKLDEEMQDLKGRLVGVSKSHREKHIDVRYNRGVANTLVTGWGCSGMSTANYILENGILRDPTINECELLMTWPKDITKYGLLPSGETIEIPLKERYKMCGNGVVSKMIPHILSNLK